MAEEIGVLRVDLSLDSADFVKSTQQVDSKLRALNSEFKASKSGVEGFEKSVEGLRAKQDHLTKTLDLQKTKVNALKEEYEKVAQAKGKNSVEAEKLLTKYNNSVAAMRKTELQLEKTNQAIKEQETVWKKAESGIEQYKKKLEEASQNLSNFGDRAQTIGGNLSLGLTTPILAAGAAVGMIAAQFEESQIRIQNALGATEEEAKQFSQVAENIWAKGFGDSLEEVSDALIRVKQNVKGISDEAELERVTRDALILAKTFDSDVNEVTRAAQNSMSTFGVTSKEAFDTFAKAAQNGANFSNEMFDNIAEYAPLAAKAGYSFAEYMNIVSNASAAGVYNLDYVNDLLKETQIRLKDGSKATSDAMSLMSKEANDLWKAYLKGDKTVSDVLPKIVSELANMEDQTLANQIAVALMGTKFEDMEADAVYSIFSVKKAIDGTAGSMDKMAKAQEQTFNQRWQSLLRQAQEQLEPIGNKVLDIAEKFLPKLSNGLDRVVTWFDELGDEGQNLILTLAGIAAAAGPLLMGGGLIASGASNVLNLASSFAGAATKGGLLGTVMGAMSGPAGWAVLGATAVTGLGVAIYNLAKDSEQTTEELIKMQEEAFNNSVSAYENAKAVNDLAIEYDNLRDKSQLTTTELLEFVDIQKQLESTNSPQKIAELTARQNELQAKSGLSNEELSRMVQLDSELQSSVDGVVLVFDEKGNAVVKYTEDLKKATQAEFEYQKSQLAETMAKGLDQYTQAQEKINQVVQERIKAYEDEVTLHEELNASKSRISEVESERNRLTKELKVLDEQRSELSGRELIDLENKIVDTQTQLSLINDQYATELSKNDELSKQYQKAKEIHQEKLAELSTLEKQVAEIEYHYEQMLNILAAEVGIKGEQGKQIDQMKDLLNKNNEQIRLLEAKERSGQRLNESERQQLQKLKEQNSQIQANIGEAEEWNAILGYDITKKLIVNDNGKIKLINDELAKTIYKQLVVTETGSKSNGHGRLLKYQGDKSFEGGPALVGELGKERAILPSGRRIDLGTNGMEFVNLPKGTRILNHLETAKQDGLLPSTARTVVPKDFNLENRLKNIRWFAEGGILTRPTLFGQYGNTLLGGGEAGNEAILPLNEKNLGTIGKAIADTMSNQTQVPSTIVVQSVLDGRIVAESVTPFVSTIQGNDLNSQLRRSGVKR